MRTRRGWLWDVLILSACTSACVAFSFEWTDPTECGTMQFTWTGGSGPFSMLILPELNAQIIHDIPNSAVDSNGHGSFSFPLTLPHGKRIVMTMSDSTGFGSGGISEVLVVGAPTGGASCDTSDVSAFTFALPLALQQCAPFSISLYPGAILPVTLQALVPGGTPLTLPNHNSDSIGWTANARAGTSIIFSLIDSQGRTGGTSPILTVADSPDTSCFDIYAPSSTMPLPENTSSPTPSSLSTSSSSSTGAESTSPSSQSSSSTSASSSATASQSASSSSGIPRTTLAAAVAGGTAGGLFVLAFIVFSLLWCRRKNATWDSEVVDLADEPVTPTPGVYEPGPYSPPGSTSYHPVSIISTPWTPPGQSSELEAGSSSRTSAAAGSTSPLMRERSATSHPASRPATYVLHTDSEDVQSDVIELPPQYNESRAASPARLGVRSSTYADGSSQSASVNPSEKDLLVLSPRTNPLD